MRLRFDASNAAGTTIVLNESAGIRGVSWCLPTISPRLRGGIFVLDHNHQLAVGIANLDHHHEQTQRAECRAAVFPKSMDKAEHGIRFLECGDCSLPRGFTARDFGLRQCGFIKGDPATHSMASMQSFARDSSLNSFDKISTERIGRDQGPAKRDR